MSKLFFTPAADEDLLDILNHIAQHRPMTARKWYHALREKCEFLGDNPTLGQLRAEFGQNCRSFSVNRWVIYFRVSSDAVEILRVLDGARDVDSLLG